MLIAERKCPFDARPCVRPRCAICDVVELEGDDMLELTTPELAGIAELLHEKLQRSKPFAGEHPDIHRLRTSHWRTLLEKISAEYQQRTDRSHEDGGGPQLREVK